MSQSLANLFTEILDLREQLGSPIRSLMRSPLPSEQVSALFERAEIRPPQVLLDLYAISDGFDLGVHFIGDMRLLPLDAAITAFTRWTPVLREHGHPSLFPITEDEFGAAFGVLLSNSMADPPVLSLPLQSGTDQFYDSVVLMLATLAAWLRAGLKGAYDSEEGDSGELERYLAIGRDLNPRSCYGRAI